MYRVILGLILLAVGLYLRYHNRSASVSAAHSSSNNAAKSRIDRTLIILGVLTILLGAMDYFEHT